MEQELKALMERIKLSIDNIDDDVCDGCFDNARSHIEILKRQIEKLNEKLK